MSLHHANGLDTSLRQINYLKSIYSGPIYDEMNVEAPLYNSVHAKYIDYPAEERGGPLFI